MSNRKVMTIHLIIGLIKMILLYKMSYFPKLYTKKNKREVESYLSDYATKSELKSTTCVDTSQFAKKIIQPT